MAHVPPKLLTFILVFFTTSVFAREIWVERFSLPDKGIWGDYDGVSIHKDLEEINWTLDYFNIDLSAPDDYAKTVSTSGGRFECRDINGEVTWHSTEIDISEFKNVKIELQANETGSGANEETKYLLAYYILDNSEKMLFETNGENRGNWGIKVAEQSNLNGQKLQIVIAMNNHYSTDKVILDEIRVTGVEKHPVEVYAGDVLINEVLFNPVEGGTDYVEIYNYSEKYIPLDQLYLASRDKNMELVQIYLLDTKRTILQPNEYIVLTKDTSKVFPYFNIKCIACFLQMNRFPSFNNGQDYVVLLNEELEVIDELFYTDKMHSQLLSDAEGITLERKSFNVETNNPDNWHSASTSSGYGTPGYENSQFQKENLNKPKVSFEPDSFSPNSDGYNDELRITYKIENPGYLINIDVFDAAGRKVTSVAKNEISGTTGYYIWDGKNETGQKQPLGVYIVLVELYNTKGNLFRYKEGVVLTGILE